jgi:hypothetical protein
MKMRTKRIIAGAGAAVLLMAGAAVATTTAQAAETLATCKAHGSNDGDWLIPDGSGSWAGHVYWNDNNSSGDLDNFEIDDRDLDGQSSSLWVKNNYTGKTYYKHAYSGESYCMDIGSLPNGKTASWKACGWDDGTAVACRTGTIEE